MVCTDQINYSTNVLVIKSQSGSHFINLDSDYTPKDILSRNSLDIWRSDKYCSWGRSLSQSRVIFERRNVASDFYERYRDQWSRQLFIKLPSPLAAINLLFVSTSEIGDSSRYSINHSSCRRAGQGFHIWQLNSTPASVKPSWIFGRDNSLGCY